MTLNLWWRYDQSWVFISLSLSLMDPWQFNRWDSCVQPQPSQLLKQSANQLPSTKKWLTNLQHVITIYNWKLETQRFFCQRKTTFHPLSVHHPSTIQPCTRHGTNTHPLGRLRANRGDPEPSTTSLALTPLRCVPSWSWIRIRTAAKNIKGISWLIAWECAHLYIYMYI